jgi:hypothetical protein
MAFGVGFMIYDVVDIHHGGRFRLFSGCMILPTFHMG